MNKRIKKLSELCTKDGVIDIGSDHGYLLLLLGKKGFVNLLGIEVNLGPFKNLQKNLKELIDEQTVKVLLSDGLSSLKEVELSKYNFIVISGMGGKLIWQIIEQDLQKFRNKKLILQPNSNQKYLRTKIIHHDFTISDELIVNDKKIYNILIVDTGIKNQDKYDKYDYEYGLNYLMDKKVYLYFSSELEKIKNLKRMIKSTNILYNENIEKENYIKKRMKDYENK